MKFDNPRSVAEVLVFLDTYGHRGELLAGGTDIVVKFKEDALASDVICNLSLVEELRYISEDEGKVRIGALATHDDVMSSTIIEEYVPLLRDACRTVGSPQIRNRGTIGGNIGTASPAGDTLPVLVALGAKLLVICTEGERVIPIKDFFIGPGKTVLRASEMIREIIVPKMVDGEQGFYSKLGSRNALAISIVGVAAKVTCRDNGFARVEVAFGSVGPTIIYRRVRELEGSNLTKKQIWDCAQAIKEEIHPITDVRATAEYRREMCGNLLYEGLSRLLD